jgi:hypothetical protein
MTASRFAVIGCGGVGGHLAPNLCHYLHAERRAAHVVVVDGDTFEPRNRSRMRFTSCENKAVATARELAGAFGDVLTMEPVPSYVTAENIATLVVERSVVFLAVDNHATRRLVDDHCAALDDVVLISGGNDGVEDGRKGTYGSVQLVRRVGGRSLTSSLRRFHPEIETPEDRHPGELDCLTLAREGAPQLLFTNLAVASAMLSAFYGVERDATAYEEVYLDILKNRVQPVARVPAVGPGASRS